ncbi:hypothetical protein F2Q68_00039029 [Brassica cretica]|uniref:Uncharacterized protein n=2 Tax=Brassica cretica TaxID=69181 RepID=A0A8S9MJP9_BRACR|nr:hypothetical protein F2Q68_00039029 [Brassica cretica]KAF3529362.1 hypothetical protein DY000_02040695 [Brassica cretica]
MNIVLKPIRFLQFSQNQHIPSLQPGNNQHSPSSSSNRLGLSLFCSSRKRDGLGAYTILVYSHTSKTYSNNATSRQDQENAFDKKMLSTKRTLVEICGKYSYNAVSRQDHPKSKRQSEIHLNARN